MVLNEKIKKLMFNYWRKYGIDYTRNFFTQFGINIMELPFGYDRDEFITDLVLEFYGGVEKVKEMLDKIKGKTINYEDEYGNVKFKITNFIYDKGEKMFFYDVIMDGNSKILDENDDYQTAYDMWMEEGLDRDFSESMKHNVDDIVYDKITTKTGLNFMLEDLRITKPGEFNDK